jgi:CRP-like cAMP-binding protein
MLDAVDLDSLIEMLKDLVIVRGLDDTQLMRFAKSSTVIRLNPGQSPLYPEGRDDRFFVVVSGRVRARSVRGRKEPVSSIFWANDFFGAEKLLYGQTSLESAVAIEPTVLIWIATVPLAEILRETPRLRQNLKEGSELYRLRQNKHFAWLTETEKVELITRKHRIVLLISLLPPLVLGWLGVFVLWLATLVPTPSFQALARWVGIGVMGLTFLWALWRIWLWSINYYIITDQRVVWQEQVLGLYDSRTEIPMAMVMPPKLTQSRYERILGFGDVFVITDKTPVDYQVYVHIDMLDVPFPERIQAYIEQYRQQASQAANVRIDASIDSILTRYLEQPVDGGKPAALPPVQENAAPKKKPPILKRITDTFKTRLEDGGTITYRKHWTVLFYKVWLPTLLSLIVLGLLAFLLQQRVTGKIGTPSVLTLICTGFLIYTLPVGWWVYQVLDWRNDIYQLSEDKLLDIERKPFIGQVISQQYLLSKVRNLDFERAGFWQRLRNSGSIYIGTVDGDLVFHGVHEPDRIMREIYARIFALRQKNKDNEMRSQQESIARQIAAYDRRTASGRKLGDTALPQH